jgi:hypothetical protein
VSTVHFAELVIDPSGSVEINDINQHLQPFKKDMKMLDSETVFDSLYDALYTVGLCGWELGVNIPSTRPITIIMLQKRSDPNDPAYSTISLD